MSYLVQFITFLCLSMSLFAQTHQFELDGSFTSQNSPDPANPVIVNYSVSWNETSEEIQGTYRDNYYALAPVSMTGTVTTGGRNFNAILPLVSNNVKEINLSTSQTGKASGTVPITLVTQSSLGGNVDEVSSFAIMSAENPGVTAPASIGCSVGFGALTGFCGLYSGNISKISDSINSCNLTSLGQPHLELGLDTQFRLYLNVPGADTGDMPFHPLGSFVFSPHSESVAVGRRHCGELPGTTFPPEHCLNLNLNLNFTDVAGNLSFTGTYVITDERTNESCIHNIFVTRDQAY